MRKVSLQVGKANSWLSELVSRDLKIKKSALQRSMLICCFEKVTNALLAILASQFIFVYLFLSHKCLEGRGEAGNKMETLFLTRLTKKHKNVATFRSLSLKYLPDII